MMIRPVWSSPAPLLLLLSAQLLLLSLLNVVTVVSGHTTVQVLTPENFDAAINDGGLWFVKFYAPWCGHCKRLAPVLDKVAPQLDGKMSLAKVDCTLHKPLCNRYKVKGFPTLKIYLEGGVFEYPGERNANSIVDFAERMSSDAVASVSSHQEAVAIANRDKSQVAFLAYDPALTTKNDDATIDDALSSTPMLKTFGQVAKKSRAVATFALFQPGVSQVEVAKVGAGVEPFIAKIEEGVPPLLFKGSFSSANDFTDFVEQENVGLVTEMGSQNFRRVATMGRMLALAVVSPNQMTAAKEEVREIALHHDAKDRLLFAYIDGKKWKRFMEQFGVDTLPAYVIMDYSKKAYYDLESSEENPEQSMKALVDSWAKGELFAKVQGTGKKKKPFFMNTWFLAGAVALLMILFFVIPFTKSETEAMEEPEETLAKEEDDTKKDK